MDDAHRQKYVDVVQFLRRKGGKFGSTSQGTNFITAAAEGDKEELEAFLAFGDINIDQPDYDKRTVSGASLERSSCVLYTPRSNKFSFDADDRPFIWRQVKVTWT